MTPDWSALDTEITAWRDAGRRVTVWQRDDDAVAPSRALDRLLSDDAPVPLALAVIPEPATEALARRLEGADISVLVHGWRHDNHARPPAKKSEFGADRPLTARLEEANRGLSRLHALFGARVRPVFVPPWNRMDDAMLPGLLTQGYRGVSTYGAARPSAADLLRLDTHIDPVDWRGTRGLADPSMLIARTVETLRARRLSPDTAAGGIGLLTHHLVHDDAIWAFCAAWRARMAAIALPGDPWAVTIGAADRYR